MMRYSPATMMIRCAVTAAWVGLGALGCGGDDGPDDPGFEALLNDSVTAAAAADLLLDAIASVEAQCGGSSLTNCPDNIPGAPIALSVNRTRFALAYVGGALRWDVAADLVLRSPTDIPVTVPLAGKCTVHYDTSAGADSIITINFSESYVSIDSQFGGQKIVFSDPAITGLTADDVALFGGTTCQLANLGLSFFLDLLTEQLADHPGTLCGAGGAELFRECPEMTSAAWARRRANAN